MRVWEKKVRIQSSYVSPKQRRGWKDREGWRIGYRSVCEGLGEESTDTVLVRVTNHYHVIADVTSSRSKPPQPTLVV